jgi:hypothetical protein
MAQILLLVNIYMSANITSYIEKIYSDKSYISRNIDHVLLTCILFIATFLVVGYVYIDTNKIYIKDNWDKKRCDLTVIPFAGIINPEYGVSSMENTRNNFKYCVDSILKNIMSTQMEVYTAPIQLLFSAIKAVGVSANAARKFLVKLASTIGDTFSEISRKLLNIVNEIQIMIIKSLDSMSKVLAVVTTSMYVAMAGIFSIKGFLSACLKLVVFVIILIAALILATFAAAWGLMFIPIVGWIPAAALFLIGIAVIALLIIIVSLFTPLFIIISNILKRK